MVGHTGTEDACKIAIKTIDHCLSILVPFVLQKGGCLFITSDHGNIEQITNYHTGQIDTEHSTNPVPLWYISPTNHRQKTPEEIALSQGEVGGLLSDVAPTILEVMGIEKPFSMNGESLLSLLK
jgi:2,3-bisphosphoglycerate-independent phosphoglycerate mutase